MGNPLKLCYIDEDNDVVKTWEELRAQKAARGKAVDALKLTKLHYTAGNGTDLTVGLTPWSKFGHEGAPAIPFTPNIPPRKSAPPPPSTRQTAWCNASRPWCWAARRLRTSASALKRERWWRSWPAPARRCWKLWWPPTKTPAPRRGRPGGVPFPHQHERPGVLHHPLDENASCHLALGRGLNSSPPGNPDLFNDSTIHIDFMIGTPDMKIVGTTAGRPRGGQSSGTATLPCNP